MPARSEPRGREMTDTEVVAFIQRKVMSAINDEDGEVSDLRQDALDYYVGKEYGNERDGFSSVVSRETMEVVEWAKPSIMRALIRDKVASFDPVGPEDEEQAEQETDVINHVMMKKNNGFIEIYQFVTDLLMYPNGYMKVWTEEKTKVDDVKLRGQTAQQVQMFIDNPDVEINAQQVIPTVVEVQGQMVMVELYDLEVTVTRQLKIYKVEAMPPEDVLIDKDCDSIDVDDADFVCHKYTEAYSDLIEKDYDPEQLKYVGEDNSARWQDETVNRQFREDENPDSSDEDDDSMREYLVHECYARFDYDGDGIAEQRKIVVIGNEVFENEEMPYQPIVGCSAVVMSHKHIGMSYFELMRDLQLIRSVIKRQILDNAYRHNIPKRYVGEGAQTDDGATMEALEDGETENIPVEDPSQIVLEQTNNIIGDLLAVDQSLRDDIQQRTGVAPTLSLDPAVLRDSTMGAYLGAMEEATQRIELLVRLVAEVGMRPIMQKLHQCIRMYQDTPMTLKLRGEWVDVNPMEWMERDDMTIHVGVGHRNPAEKLQLLENLLGKQMQAMQMGMARPIHIYHTLEQQVDLAGLGSAEMFFDKPDPNAELQQPEDPQAGVLQAQMQIEGQKVAQKEQSEQRKHQLDMAKLASDSAKAKREHEAKMRELAVREVEAMANIQNMDMDTFLKFQQARELDIANDATEEGIEEVLTDLDRVTDQSASG